MIPILYEQNEKQFTSGGIAFLIDCEGCSVSEEINGVFECQFRYPITGAHYKDIQRRRIIYATHDDTKEPQPFIIYASSAPINGVVTFYAHHISYRLSKAVVMPFTANSCAQAMQRIEENLITDYDFTFWTDKTTVGDYAVTEPKLVRPVLGGETGSLLEAYGDGEYEFDKFEVKLHKNRGTDTDVEIRYRKNLLDIEHKTNDSETYNTIVPYWVNQETGAIKTINAGYVSYADGAPYLIAVPYPMNDYFDTEPTSGAMETKAQQLLNSSHAWEPDESFTVDFVQLWQTEEYKQYAPLQRVRLGDTVKVYYPELGVDAVKEKVVKTVYNTLLERYTEITLNELATSYSDLITQQIGAETSDTITSQRLRAAINLAIELIRGGAGGYIAIPADDDGLNEAIYVLDAPDTVLATKVLRLDENGLGCSTTGFNGPYTQIINMQGELATSALSVLLSGNALGVLTGMTLAGEDVAGYKATNPFVLTDGSGALGYRYGGTAGSGSYAGLHYFKGDVVIDGDLTVTGDLTVNGTINPS